MKFFSEAKTQTLKFGKRLAKYLKPRDIICLFGELGSGKTVFVKGIAEGLGFKKNEVISPSFLFIKEYKKKRLSLYHFDLYRLKNLEELFDLGYWEYLYRDAITVIEWAEKMERFLPVFCLRVNFFIKGKNKRLIELKAFGKRYKELISKIKNN